MVYWHLNALWEVLLNVGESHFQLRRVCTACKSYWCSQHRAKAALGRKTTCPASAPASQWRPLPCEQEGYTPQGIPSTVPRLGGELPYAPVTAGVQCPEHSCSTIPTALFSFQAQMHSALPSRLTINHRLSICDFPTVRSSIFVIFSSLCIKGKYAFISSIRKNASLH